MTSIAFPPNPAAAGAQNGTARGTGAGAAPPRPCGGGRRSRTLNRLTSLAVKAASKPGRYADGGGLYLFVSGQGRKRWVFHFHCNGKRVEMGLGSARTISLARARELAAQARALRAGGANPLEARRTGAPAPRFAAFADAWLDAMDASFANPKHRAQWRMTLERYAAPIRAKQVCAITTEDVLACLKPLWRKRPETASRLRGRIERILDAAKAKGLRTGDNPARWRGHLDQLLPKRQKLTRGHHAALPFEQIPAFITALRAREARAARALEFLILSACRSNEVRGARWGEFDLDKKIWTIPLARMKSRREHRVPLSPRMLELLAQAPDSADARAHVFPGAAKGKPLSETAFKVLLERMEMDNVTTHGFRSSFRDWAAEKTSFPREVAEMALAHVIEDKTEAAYRRRDLFDKRAKLMNAWAGYCGSEAARGQSKLSSA